MWEWFYSGENLMGLPIIALAIFMTVFVAQVVRVFVRRPADDEAASLPFRDGALEGGES
jgi:hypothetical protein